MTFDDNWIAAGFGDDPAGSLEPGDSISIDVEMFNQHQPEFGDYDGTARMDVSVVAIPSGEEDQVIEQYADVDLPPDALLESTTSHTIPEVADIEYRIDYEYEAPQQGEFSGSDSRSFSLSAEDPFDVADVEVSCSVSDEEVEIGEEVTVTVDLTNDTPSSGVVEVEAVFWDASDSVTEELSEDDEVTVEFTFVPEEEGEVEPSVSVTEA